jgi:hypothetical protein
MPILETFFAALTGAKTTHNAIDKTVTTANEHIVKPIRDSARQEVNELRENKKWVKQWQERLEKKKN